MTFSRHLLLVSLAASIALGPGCEDETARARAEVQQKIAMASRNLELASLVPAVPGDESFNRRRNTLKEIVGSLRNVPEAERGQQAAVALVTATAQRELAAMDIAEAADLDAENRSLRRIVQSHIDAAMRLDALARGGEQLSSADEQALLAEGRTRAERSLREYSETMASLDGPIAERVSQNARDAEEVARLDQEANSLRRQAAEWGHLDGLTHFLQAIDLERKADRFEYDIAQRDNDLRFELQPEHNLARWQVEYMQELLSEINASQSALDAHKRMSAEGVDTTRRLVASFRDRITEALQTISQRGSETLAPVYESAEVALGKAAELASRGATLAGGDAADSYRLEAARANEQLASLYASLARTDREDGAILGRLVEAGGVLGAPDRYRTEQSRLETLYGERLGQALEALAAAQSELEKVKGSRAEVDAFKNSIARQVEVLGGSAGDAGTLGISTSQPAGSGGSSSAGDGKCPASPDAVAAIINGLEVSDLGTVNRFLDSIQANTPASRSLVTFQREALSAVGELFGAIRDAFPGPAAEQFIAGANTGMSQTISNARVVNSDSTPRIEVHAPAAGGPMTLELVSVGGCWLIDGDSLLMGQDAAAIRETATASAPALDVFRKVATRVKSGEFSSAEEAMQTFMGELMSAMGGFGAGDPPGS